MDTPRISAAGSFPLSPSPAPETDLHETDSYRLDILTVLFTWTLGVALTIPVVFVIGYWIEPLAVNLILAADFLILALACWVCLKLARRQKFTRALRTYLAVSFLVAAIYMVLLPSEQTLIAVMGIFLLVYLATLLESRSAAWRWTLLAIVQYVFIMFLHEFVWQPPQNLEWLTTLYRFTLPGVTLLILLFMGRAVISHLSRSLARSEAMRRDVERSHEELIHRQTELNRSTSELQTLAHELEQSNRDLRDFAYVASHDLQEPLRKIQMFADRLQSKYGATVSDEQNAYLERILVSAQRMQQLINGLLTLSQITTRGSTFVAVNLETVAHQVLADLETRLVQTGGHVEVSALPTLQADPLQMRQLFQNLFDNALKFHHPHIPPLVRVSADALSETPADHSFCRITIRDNGIGFDEKYLERVFKPFERLHSIAEYDGTGMGLAICSRIIERHGGSLSATSAPGEGSVFIVTLPLQPNSAANPVLVPPALTKKETL